jgi:hypothetical protein
VSNEIVVVSHDSSAVCNEIGVAGRNSCAVSNEIVVLSHDSSVVSTGPSS